MPYQVARNWCGVESEAQAPVFEPLGGLGKAIFFDSAYDTSAAWLANADGIGATRLGQFWFCQWAARTAVCLAGHDDPNSIISFDVLAITDDGAQRAKAATNAVKWALHGRTLFYADSTGHLYAVDGLPSP